MAGGAPQLKPRGSLSFSSSSNSAGAGASSSRPPPPASSGNGSTSGPASNLGGLQLPVGPRASSGQSGGSVSFVASSSGAAGSAGSVGGAPSSAAGRKRVHPAYATVAPSVVSSSRGSAAGTAADRNVKPRDNSNSSNAAAGAAATAPAAVAKPQSQAADESVIDLVSDSDDDMPIKW